MKMPEVIAWAAAPWSKTGGESTMLKPRILLGQGRNDGTKRNVIRNGVTRTRSLTPEMWEITKLYAKEDIVYMHFIGADKETSYCVEMDFDGNWLTEPTSAS